MSRRLRTEPEATAEIEDAATWYEVRRPGLALEFIQAVDGAVKTIVKWPGFGTVVREVGDGADLRRFGVEGFPYYIGYLLTDEEIRVLAVAHERRRPGYWTSRQ